MGRGEHRIGSDPADDASLARTADRLAVMELINRHWALVDRAVEGIVADLFCTDGEMHIGQLVKAGREDIARYYVERRAQEDSTGRKTRHIISNLRTEFRADGDINFYFLASVYSGTGSFPLAAAPPSTIADFSGICRCTVQNGWLIAELRATVTFVGADAPSFAKKDVSE